MAFNAEPGFNGMSNSDKTYYGWKFQLNNLMLCQVLKEYSVGKIYEYDEQRNFFL